MTEAKKKVPVISLGDDFGEAVVKINGAEIHISADGTVVRLAAANDSAIAAAALVLGQQAADGVYAGLTADGKRQIFAMPKDLDVTMTFNDAAKAVNKLNADNALGHNDWQIPALDNLHILQKNQNEGSLKGTFKTASSSGSGYPVWYWSATPARVYPNHVATVRFSYGDESWGIKDYLRLSCRPVRLVDVPRL